MSTQQPTLAEGISHGRQRIVEKLGEEATLADLTDAELRIIEAELESDYSAEELATAADEAGSTLEVKQDLRIPFHTVKHDLRLIGRLDDLAKGRSLAEELRAEDDEDSDDDASNRYTKYKRGGE